MKSEKVLTIVIPAYNMEKYLGKCCDSLLISENLNTLDVLIINDGSTDTTSDIAHTYENKYSNVFRVIDKENGHYGSCINRGLKEARGFFIKILDADDTFDNTAFNNYVKFLLSLSTNDDAVPDMIITDTVHIDELGKLGKAKTFQIVPNAILSFEILTNSDLARLTHHSLTYKTEILRQMEYEQTEKLPYTDQEWAKLPLLSIRKFAYFPHVVYLYLVGRLGQSMELQAFVKNMWMQLAIKKHTLDFYEEHKHLYKEINKERFKKKMIDTTASIYKHYLLCSKRQLSILELIEFDNYLKENYREFYDALNTVKYSKQFPIRYIAYWRQSPNGWRSTLVYLFYVMSINTKKFFKKLLGKK